MKTWRSFVFACGTMAIGLPFLGHAQEPAQLPAHYPPLLVDGGGQEQNPGEKGGVVVTSTFDKARLDASNRRPDSVLEAPMSFSQQDALKNALREAVFTVRMTKASAHALASSGVSWDGACVALSTCPDGIAAMAQAPENFAENAGSPYSVFGRDLERYSSPFAERGETKDRQGGTATCYLTTADWLTDAETIQIMIHDRPVRASLVKRDEAQNVAVLMTPFQPRVRGRTVAAFDAPQSPVAYALLEPWKMYESFTPQSFVVDAPHLYGRTSLLARNGYPLFNSRGEIVGLTVSPLPDRTKAHVVHYMLIDRALYPEKYDRTVHEQAELRQY